LTLLETTTIQRKLPLAGDVPASITFKHAQELISAIRQRLNTALRGKSAVVESVLACLLARGHLLLEDVPGLGKTTLAKALALAVGGRFNRVQCTPDLLPGDITGFSVFNQKTREFEFLPGPVFADVMLVDEVNRATPRTQSALLEAMAEHQVTVDNTRHILSDTFFIIATQNPGDQHGTYPLPEAQLDRFAMKLSIGYPDPEHELSMLEAAVGHCCDAGASDEPLLAAGELHRLQERVVAVSVGPAVREYLVAVAGASRQHRLITLGASPRGLLTWQRVSQAIAFLNGREFVTPDDVQDAALPVLSVRLATDASNISAVIKELIATVPVPVGTKRKH
jgi:MoxR-like ATPase